MFWTPELASYLEDAPFPATKEELLDYGNRSGCPYQVLENLYELDDTDELVEGIEDLWPEYEDHTNDEYSFSNLNSNSNVDKLVCSKQHACVHHEDNQAQCLFESDEQSEGSLPPHMTSNVVDIHAGDQRTCIVN